MQSSPSFEPQNKEKSIKENRIRNITNLYYSRPEVRKAIFEFSKNREISPRYFEGFGKRPDAFQYVGDIFELVKRGATSFHCSEELWSDPLEIETGMPENELNEIRVGWDLLIDIDSKYFDYSKVLAEQIIKFLEFHGVKHIGIKFSGSKGFHLIVPWKAFPKEINGIKTSDMFPLWPRIVSRYITEKTKTKLIEEVTKLTTQSKYVRDFKASEEVMPDIILVSPRHLFRMPYSLHEKTSLASVVLNKDEVKNFEMKHADPMKLNKENVRKFMPDSVEGEASELLMQALDWDKEQQTEEESSRQNKKRIVGDYKPIKLENLSDSFFSPSIRKILEGVKDGKKRGTFILINFFRSIGMDREELEKRVYDWNKKNEIPLKEGYIKSQLSWSYRHKMILPPNFNKDYYEALGAKPSPEELRYKSPTNYTVRKFFQAKENEKENRAKEKKAKKKAVKKKVK